MMLLKLSPIVMNQRFNYAESLALLRIHQQLAGLIPLIVGAEEVSDKYARIQFNYSQLREDML